MEMAIIKNGEFVRVGDVIKNEDLVKKISECYDGMIIYPHTPVELIDKLYNELKYQHKRG